MLNWLRISLQCRKLWSVVCWDCLPEDLRPFLAALKLQKANTSAHDSMLPIQPQRLYWTAKSCKGTVNHQQKVIRLLLVPHIFIFLEWDLQPKPSMRLAYKVLPSVKCSNCAFGLVCQSIVYLLKAVMKSSKKAVARSFSSLIPCTKSSSMAPSGAVIAVSCSANISTEAPVGIWLAKWAAEVLSLAPNLPSELFAGSTST